MCLYLTYLLRFIYSVNCSLFGAGSALLYVHHSHQDFLFLLSFASTSSPQEQFLTLVSVLLFPDRG